MFAKEIRMYVDYFEKLVKKSTADDREIKTLREFKDNLRASMEYCLEIAGGEPYPGENLDSIKTTVEKESKRTKSIWLAFKARLKLKEVFREGISPAMELGLSTNG